MKKIHSLLSSLVLSIGLTVAMGTSAIASPYRSYNVRQSGVRVIINPGRNVTPRYRRSNYYNSRYNRDRNYYQRDCCSLCSRLRTKILWSATTVVDGSLK